MSKELEKILAQAGAAAAAAAAADRLEGEHRVPLAHEQRAQAAAGWLQPVRHVHRMRLSDLQGIGPQIAKVEQNTRQFMEGRPANNVLLTGARGTGKSSIVKGLLNKYSPQGPAPDRGGEKRPRRPAGDRRPGGEPAGTLPRCSATT